jgi:hypothetical protein
MEYNRHDLALKLLNYLPDEESVLKRFKICAEIGRLTEPEPHHKVGSLTINSKLN